MPRLTPDRPLPEIVRKPGYVPGEHGTGIVHIGLGAFFRAHQAVYTDNALALAGGNWRIVGVSLRSTSPVEELGPQDGAYTLIERGEGAPRARVVCSIARALSGSTDLAAIRSALADPAIRIVSLTVTEKGYGIDRATGGIDKLHAAVAADLTDPAHPRGVLGLLVQALGARRAAGVPPFTVLCCDNLPDNGSMLRGGVVDFARHVAPELADWIADEVAFPATMVDRITPARTRATLSDAARLTGWTDLAAIETEPFTQWVIEDRFTGGRPAWDAAGAIFVRDVAPYEAMKLRMLNGSHSMLAYAGYMAGHRYVRDTMADASLRRLIERHLAAAAATLDPLPGIDFAQYGRDLAERFANPAIAHETYQIAMDGTQKLPQRILQPAAVALERRQPLRPFAFATAAWMRYALGRTEAGAPYDLRDPMEAEIARRLDGVQGARDVYTALSGLHGVFPGDLRDAEAFREPTVALLGSMLGEGMAATIAAEAQEGAG